MNYKMLKNEIKQEKRNYYDKNIMKRLFIKTPNSKIYKIIKDAKIYRYYKENHKSIFKNLNLYITVEGYTKILLNILLNYMESLEKI